MIRLTSLTTGKPVILNPDNVCAVEEAERGSVVFLANQQAYQVSETAEMIENLLGGR